MVLVVRGRTGAGRPARLHRSDAALAGLASARQYAWYRADPSRVVAAALLAGAVLLVASALLFGPLLLFGFPVIAVAILLVLRPRFRSQEIGYAIILSLVAGVAGLGAGWIEDFSPLAWGALQVLLVLVSLLAGWGIARHTGLLAVGIGRSTLLCDGVSAAGRAFAIGMLIGVPWGLANVVFDAAADDTWVRSWWRPLVAIQPGIAEEAWGRVFLVPLLFLFLRRSGRTPVALTAAVLVAGYWFAYLHTYDKSGMLVSTVMLGTLFALPLSWVWLQRGIETAIGFHFLIDLVRFIAAFVFYEWR